MALESKAMLLNEMERSLSTMLTASDMSKVLSLLADKLTAYTVDLSPAHAPVAAQDDLLQAYLDTLSVEGKSPRTIKHYAYVLTRLRNALDGISPRQVTVYHLRQYLSSEKARGISDRTLEGNRQTISAYFHWLYREGLIPLNPTANLAPIKYRKKQRKIYSEAEFERMKFHCASLRDRAIILFLRATGCRISEMVGLNRQDLDFTNQETKVLGKGNKERVVYFDSVTAMVLQEYLTTRTDSDPALFNGRGSPRLTPSGVRRMLCNLGVASHVDHVHPHKFRRTTATSLLRHGMPVQEVAAILGHEKIDTTMMYVVLDQRDIKNAYQKYA